MYKEILVGEYSNYFIQNDGKVSTYDNNKLSVYSLPEPIITGAAGHPWANVISESGQVYHALGDNTQWKKVPITGAISSTAYYTHHVIVGAGGSLTVYNDKLEVVSLKVPGRIVKAVAAAVLLALDDKGGVWKYNWISSGKIVKPHAELAKLAAEKINLPGPATDIATSRSLFSAAVVNGSAVIWCDAFGAPYVGQKKATGPIIPNWQPKNIKQIGASDNTLMMIDGNDEMWSMGNNWVGQVGNGEIDPRVLAGNADMGNRTFVSEPVNISRGRKWKRFWLGTYYAFRSFAQDIRGNIYAWGYGKFGLPAHGIRPQDDPANVGITAITIPWRVGIPQMLSVASTADIKSGKVKYPPAEPKVLIKTVKYYDDGTEEVVNE